MSGMFFTFEGGEGSGKTTQIKRLVERLRPLELDVELTREVGGTEGAELIRKLVQHVDAWSWDGRSEALLNFAARRDHVEKRIKPAIDRGALVLSDRFFDSTYVYQGAAQGISFDEIDSLRHFAIGDFAPEATFLFDFDPEEGLARARQDLLVRGEKNSRFEDKGLAFHHLVRDGYLKMARRDPSRFHIIDASGSIEEVEQKLWEQFEPFLTRYQNNIQKKRLGS